MKTNNIFSGLVYRTGWALCVALLLSPVFTACDNPSVTPDFDTVHAAPSPGPSLTPGEGYVQVQFTVVATASGYELYYSATNDPNSAIKFTGEIEVKGKLVQAFITGLQNGTTYFVWARAVYKGGVSAFSEPGSAMPRFKPQNPPANLVVSPSNGVLELTWSQVENADSYMVYWDTDSTKDEDTPSVEFGGEYVCEVMGMLSSLTNNTTYNVWISAKNTSGEGPLSGPVSGVPSSSVSTPSAPKKPLLTGSDTKIIVRWEPVKQAKSYKLYYNTADSTTGASSLDGVGAGPGYNITTITGLENGQSYYIWVTATNDAGESSRSPSNDTKPYPKPALNMSDSRMKIGVAAQRFPNEETGKGDRLSRKQETALGDLVADSMAYWIRKHKDTYSISGNIDFAFFNGGVITGGLAKGTITVGTVNSILYADNMSIITLSGSQILTLFQYVAQVRHDGGGGGGTGAFGQVSKEVRYTINYTYGDDRRYGDLENFTLNGQPLAPDTYYTFITNTYLVNGGDGYGAYMLTDLRKDTGLSIANAVAEYIYDQDMVPIVPVTDGRITLVGEIWSTSSQMYAGALADQYMDYRDER